MPKRKSTKPSSSLRSALIFATLAILGYLGVSLATGTGPVASFLGSSPIVADLTPYGDIRDVTVKEKRDQKIERGEAPPLTKSQQKSEDVGIADAIDQKKTADENAGDRIIQAAKDDKENEALNQAAARIEAKRTTSTASKVDCSVKCQTIGSPVCSGSYVFTGAGWDSSTGESTRKPNSGGRECTKCGSGDGGVGEFDGSSQSCGDLISSGAPVIIPSSVDPASIGLPPTDSEGKPLRIVSCAEKRDGGWVLSAFGQLAGSEKNADKICGIGGSWINGDVFSAEMAKICKDKDTSYCKSYNSDSDNSRDGSNALETPEAGKQDECQAGFIGVGTRTYIECVVGKKVIRDCGSGGSWNLTKKACDDTTPAANTTRCGPGYTVSGTSCQATATPVILDNYRSNCRGTYDIQTGLCSDSPTVRLTGDPTYQNSGTSFDQNSQNISTSTSSASSKQVGEKCSNSIFWNTCNQCPGSISELNSGGFMCGSPEEVETIANANYVEPLPASENTHTYDITGKRPIKNDENCETYETLINPGGGSSRYCEKLEVVQPTTATEAELPSTIAQTTGSALTGAAILSATGAAVCGIGAFVIGNMLTGLGGFIGAGPAAATCAAWGAGIGGLGAGIISYSDAPTTIKKDIENTTNEPIELEENNHTYDIFGKRPIKNDENCDPDEEYYRPGGGSARYCRKP